ncbi:MAG: presenilin family intramembrane aspartyl protease [Nanoarchaeota archaeon]|nr:presenilin family intramembrane aspartyl protease [Nanoarchaeota archaeon]
MKHKIKVTFILLALFLIIQFIGLYVVNVYTPIKQEVINTQTGISENITINELPYGMQAPEFQTQFDFWNVIPSLIVSFIIAIVFILILTKYKWKAIIKFWFFSVVILAIGITVNAIFLDFNLFSSKLNIFSNQVQIAWLISALIATPFAFFKIYKPNILVHNFSELMIYPGIAAVFIPILNIYTIIFLLIIISIYDMWAVWHSGIMQKMAKFQIQELQVFNGLLIPYMSKTVKGKIAEFKKSKKTKKQKLKVSLAILGGGDIVFPIIVSGIFLRQYGLIPALITTAGAFLGLMFLFIISKKGKSYPAMPFISIGIFIAMAINLLIT